MEIRYTSKNKKPKISLVYWLWQAWIITLNFSTLVWFAFLRFGLYLNGTKEWNLTPSNLCILNKPCVLYMLTYACMFGCVLSLQPHGLQHARLLCPWNFPGRNTGVDCHFLPQGIFPTQGSNTHLLCLQNWQADYLPLRPKPLTVWITTNCGKNFKRQEYQTTCCASWEICV